MVPTSQPAWQLYLHVPFCERKCNYCDFASWESPGVTQRAWLETVLREIDYTGNRFEPGPIRTVFFGGGTPSVISVSFLENIVRKLENVFDLRHVEEMTLEANPSSLTTDKIRGWRDLGFNRVSLGVQSFDAEELRLLGRVHSPEGARTALEALASEPDLRFSADLIFGLPGQSEGTFLSNLETLMEYRPRHVSFYGLTVEEDTEFARWQAEGRLKLPDSEAYRSLYRAGVDFLQSRGLSRYEISNFAKPGQECLHNQGYWRDAPYLSFGPGAHSYDGQKRWMNPWELSQYLQWGEEGFSDSKVEWDELDTEAKLCESISLGLRQAQGIRIADLGNRFGVAWPESTWVRWEKSQCLARSAGYAHLLEDGWALLDEISVDLLAKARPA